MTDTKQIPSSHVCSTEKSRLKEFLVNQTLWQSRSTDEDESKGIIVNKNLLQSCSTDKDESKCIIVNEWYREEEKSEFVTNKQKDAKNEVTYDVPIYFNVFECGRNILERLDVSYGR